MSSRLRPVCQFKYVHITEGDLGQYCHVYALQPLFESHTAKIILDKASEYVCNNIDMRAQPSDDPRLKSLREFRALHRHPEKVQDETFRSDGFFDPRDLLQVRYEMLRRHSVEGVSIVDVAANFGVSRPTVYQAQAAFQQAGLSGLIPKQRGPREGHKLSAEVIGHVRALRAAEPALTTVACVKAVQEKFGITVHRRSLERALASKKKPRYPA